MASRTDAAARRVAATNLHVAPEPFHSSLTTNTAPTMASAADWALCVGRDLGVGQWTLVDQRRVDAFAECTGDHQWIHKMGAVTPFGGPIAHGLLTLSLLPTLLYGILPNHLW